MGRNHRIRHSGMQLHRGLRRQGRPRHQAHEASHIRTKPQLLHKLPTRPHVFPLLHVELCRTPERPSGQRRGKPRKLDQRHPRHRQRPPWRPVAAAARPGPRQQRPQRLLHAPSAARRGRTPLAVHARTTRHRAVLGGVLPLLHDRHSHRALPEPDPLAAT